MSHELTIRSNGKAEMAYLNTNEAPWHGLGNPLERGLSIEQWTIAAGMDFRIQRSKVRYFTDRIGVNQLEWPEKHVLFRGDTHEPLGVVSAKYKVVQPREVLEFFRDLCESNHFELSTAGTLFGGAKYWALAKVGDESYIAAIMAESKLVSSAAAQRGTALHGAIERRDFAGPWADHVRAVERAMETESGLLLGEGEFEHSFANGKMGYGGKVDWHSRDAGQGAVVDWKSKDRIEDGARLAWDEHAMQLAAYRHGLGMQAARAVNVFVSVADARVVVVEHDEAALQRGLRMFRLALRLWREQKEFAQESDATA